MSFHVFLITAIVGVSMIAALTVFLQRHGWWSTTSTLVIVSSCLVGAALIATEFLEKPDSDWTTSDTDTTSPNDHSSRVNTTLFPRRSSTYMGYVTSTSCRKCHQEEYDSWHATYHRTMTQPATPETVVAPFDNLRLTSGNQHATVRRKGDEFWVEMVDPFWERVQVFKKKDASLVFVKLSEAD